MTPDIEKPVPVNAAALMVTGALPVEFNVSDWVAVAPTSTLPKETLVAPTLKIEEPAIRVVAPNNFIVYVREKPAEVAVIVTVCVVETVDATTLKPVLVAPAETVTAAGTVTAALLLERFTTILSGAETLRYTEQAFVSMAVKVVVPQETALNDAELVGELVSLVVPVPFKLTAATGLDEELPLTVI